MKSRSLVLSAAALALIAAITGCILDREAKGGSIVENEATAGTLYTEAGAPAVGAVVKAVPVDYVPNKALPKIADDTAVIRTFKTDANGRYNLKTLPPGQYNIFGELDGAHSFLDSLVIGKNEKPIPSDTLKEPGSITGVVALEPNHDRRRVFIQVLGTNLFTNVDSAGRFTLRNLARGAYPFRAVTDIPEYVPYFGNFGIRENKDDTLADTIRLVYTGIPIVRNLSATYDTAAGTVRLAWSPVKYEFLKEYLIYRSDVSSSSPALVPLAKVTDTAFFDDLAGQGLQTGDGKTERKYEYRVQIRSKSLDIGPTFESIVLQASAKDRIRTTFNLAFLGAQSPSVRILDTFRIVLKWNNPGRSNDSLSWELEGTKAPLRTVSLKGKEGVDTLVATAPAKAGNYLITARIRDDAGDVWSSQLQVQVILDAPTADAGADTTVTVSDTVWLRGIGTDKLGRIVKKEWDIGNTGRFITVSKDTAIIAPSDEGYQYHVFRVTDDDGMVAVDTLRVAVRNDVPSPTLTVNNRIASKGGGYTLSSTFKDLGHIVQWEWDLGDGTFSVGGKDTSFVPISASGSTLKCRVRMTDDDGNKGIGTLEFKVSRWNLVSEPPLPGASVYYSSTATNGRFFVFGGRSWEGNLLGLVYYYDPVLDKWTQGKTMPKPIYHSTVAGVNGKLYVFGTCQSSYNCQTPEASAVYEYDPKWDEWQSKRSMPYECMNCYTTSFEGKILVYNQTKGRTDRFDPVTDSWEKVVDDIIQGPFTVLGRTLYGYVENARSIGEYTLDDGHFLEKTLVSSQNRRFNVVSVGSKIYYAGTMPNWGGINGASILEYDPATDRFTQKSESMAVISGQNVAVIDGKIFALGEKNLLMSYDPASEP